MGISGDYKASKKIKKICVGWLICSTV